ncbi:MAG: adenosine kinase [Marinilabiliaceae bacterium]|nr:adenosine kinase [Marinilabiliaceae bacterium]
MEAKVLGLGNALVDILVRIPNDSILEEFGLPRGSMQLVEQERSQEIYNAIKQYNPQIVAGGSASNTINGLANLGVATGMIGKIGRNEIGSLYKKDIINAGIDPVLFESDTQSGNCISLISTDSERTMATCLGAAIELTADEINEDMFKGYTHFYVEGYLVQNKELIEKALSIAHDKGLTTCIDLASYNVVEENLEFLKKIISRYVDIVFANEEEATAFSGKEEKDALDEIGEYAETVIVKLGCRGSLIKVGTKTYHVGIVESKAIDTTGAGDLYASGFLYGLINGFTPEKCAEIGAIVSGNVIEVIGPKMDISRWNSIRQNIKKLAQQK